LIDGEKEENMVRFENGLLTEKIHRRKIMIVDLKKKRQNN